MKKGLIIIVFCAICMPVCAKVDYLRVMFNHNASYQATIGWCQISGDAQKIQLSYQPIDSNLNSAIITTYLPTVSNTFKGLTNVFLRLSGLRPGTRYYFNIVDTEGTSETYSFSTVSNNPEDRLSLIGGGDSRTRRKERQEAFKMAGKLYPHAILFDGDYTDIDNAEKWRLWFEDWTLTYKINANRLIPIIPARGNHERTNKDLVNFFDCPSAKNYYNVTMGGDLINIICLNTEISFKGAQRQFLKRTLDNYDHFYWQLPQYHRSCRPHVAWKMKMRAVKKIYKHWIPLLEKYGVRLVLECDSHITKSTYPIVQSDKKDSEEGFERDDENGIVYVGEGCWGAPLRTPDQIRSWSQHVDKIDSFKWFFIDQNKIEVRTVAYMNADEVKTLTGETRFKIPGNLNLWPEQNPVITIRHKVNCD